MATPKTGNPPGAPPKDFLSDPDRYTIALATMLFDIIRNRRKALMFAIAWMEAIEIKNPSRGGLKARVNRALAEGRSGLVAFRLPSDDWRDGHGDPWEARISTLTKKIKRKVSGDPEKLWLEAMGAAFKAVVLAKEPHPNVVAYIVAVASAVGERECAVRVLIPMLRAKFEPPEFLPQI